MSCLPFFTPSQLPLPLAWRVPAPWGPCESASWQRRDHRQSQPHYDKAGGSLQRSGCLGNLYCSLNAVSQPPEDTHLCVPAAAPRPEEAEVLGALESWAPASGSHLQLLHCTGNSTSSLAAANTEEALNVGWDYARCFISTHLNVITSL